MRQEREQPYRVPPAGGADLPLLPTRDDGR